MAKDKTGNRNTIEWIILIVIVMGIALVLFELYSNVLQGMGG